MYRSWALLPILAGGLLAVSISYGVSRSGDPLEDNDTDTTVCDGATCTSSGKAWVEQQSAPGFTAEAGGSIWTDDIDSTSGSGVNFVEQTTHSAHTVTCATATDDFDINWNNGNIVHFDMEDCDQDANDVNAPTNPVESASYTISIEQSAAGTEDLTWNAVFLFPGGTDPVLTQSANAIDVVSCVYVDARYLCSFGQDYQ